MRSGRTLALSAGVVAARLPFPGRLLADAERGVVAGDHAHLAGFFGPIAQPADAVLQRGRRNALAAPEAQQGVYVLAFERFRVRQFEAERFQLIGDHGQATATLGLRHGAAIAVVLAHRAQAHRQIVHCLAFSCGAPPGQGAGCS
jgi:hypothetical protein